MIWTKLKDLSFKIIKGVTINIHEHKVLKDNGFEKNNTFQKDRQEFENSPKLNTENFNQLFYKIKLVIVPISYCWCMKWKLGETKHIKCRNHDGIILGLYHRLKC